MEFQLSIRNDMNYTCLHFIPPSSPSQEGIYTKSWFVSNIRNWKRKKSTSFPKLSNGLNVYCWTFSTSNYNENILILAPSPSLPQLYYAKNSFVTHLPLSGNFQISCLFLGFSLIRIFLSKWKRLDWTDRCVGKRAILLEALLPYNGRYKAKISPRLALTEPALQFQKLKAAICKNFIAVMSWFGVDLSRKANWSYFPFGDL